MAQRTLKRRVINAVEASGGHRLLGWTASLAAKRVTKQDVQLFFDEIWIRRVGDFYFGDKVSFDYYLNEFRSWNAQHDLWINEPRDIWYYSYTPAAGDVIVDIGAGFGNDAVMFSRSVGPAGRVISVEAHPHAVRRLFKTCKWSNLDNVTPIGVAVGAENGLVHMAGDNYSAESEVLGQANGSGDVEVPLRKFDDIAAEQNLERVSLLKMNIEGAEIDALKGMPRTLAITSSVVVSCHDFRAERGDGEYFRTKSKAVDILTAASFKLEERKHDPRPYVRDTLYGVREGADG